MMDIKEISQYLKPQMERVEAWMDASLKSDIALLDSTNRSLRGNSGKMIRPMLALLCGGACGQVNEDTFRFAAAAELMHNATLMHDDVVDGAAERRGMPAVAALLNGPAAVLLGDFWLVRSMQLILDAEENSGRAVRIFSKTLSDLAEGELLQMQKAASADTSEEDYIRIVFSKTASLFEAAALSAAVSVKAPAALQEAVTAYARNLGIAFQIKDDLFDYEADGSTVGKPVGVDLLEQKITQPLLCALETVPADEAAAVRKKVADILDRPSLAAEIRAFVMAHDGLALAAKKLVFYIEKAISCLAPLPDSTEKQYLAKLARYVGERNK